MVMQKQRARKLHCGKMAALFMVADSSGDGFVNEDEFRKVVSAGEVSTWLAAQGLDVSEPSTIFHFLAQGRGKLSVDDVWRLKGAARSVDVLLMQESYAKLWDKVGQL